MKSLERGIRLDLFIAVCALLISSLAMAASWLQSRETAHQTQVLEEQLSAQVWPYIGFGADAQGDAVRFSIENDGLGPAVIRNLTLTLDGKSRSDFGELLHTLLGAHFMTAKPPGELLSVHMGFLSPGGVIRPGTSIALLSLKSKHYAARLSNANGQIDLNVCYCAIIPEKCWQNDTSTNAPPKPVESCPEIRNDMLHVDSVKVLKQL